MQETDMNITRSSRGCYDDDDRKTAVSELAADLFALNTLVRNGACESIQRQRLEVAARLISAGVRCVHAGC